MQNFLCFYLFLTFIVAKVHAQTSTSSRIESFEKLKKVTSPLDGILFRNIGPSIMSGRVTDFEVNPNNPTEFYVAYASGGVWHTINNGQSFLPIFDHEATHTIGDIAVNWTNHTIWIGTGEVNSSRSSYAGTGIYQSNDTGRTWKHLGLEESHHIGQIILHPSNEKIAWVAVLGHLYTKNKERGIYKTIDGGKSWEHALYINDSTGCVDLQIDLQHPDVLYASAWMRTRQAWNFVGNGEGSGIYKSKDGGKNWASITSGKNGFPQGKGVGRIGLNICASKPSTLYAILDNNFNQEKRKNDELKKIKAKDFVTMQTNDFLKLDEKLLKDFLKSNAYPEKYTAENLKISVQKNEFSVKDIADWKLGDADNNLFDTEIIGAELYRSDDAGVTWRKTHESLLAGVVFTYGYYFGTIKVSPSNPERLIIGGYAIVESLDGGKNFIDIGGKNCHPDYHRIWINPLNEKHLIVGNDGGINISYDGGTNWFKANNPPVGQFYTIQVDDAKPYNVYGGLQDNGTWTASSKTIETTAWHQEGINPFKSIGDGDGMQVQIDTRNNETIYVGYQFGNYFRMNKSTLASEEIKVVNDIGEKSFRFNWQTPILLSKHNQDIFYMGSNHFHRSMKQGDEMKTLSSSLTQSTNKGNVPFGTLTSLSESPKRFGLIYAGADDGTLHCSKDVGYSWNKISNPLPQNRWITRVIASEHREADVYVSLNGMRNDDFKPYLYFSDNYGKTWKQIGTDLPDEPINVIKEDPTNPNIIYVGTDNGLYVSFNRNNFIPWQSNLPRVAIHDIAIQTTENEIVLGTHGRSIYIAPLQLVQQYPQQKNKQWNVMDIDSVFFSGKLGSKSAIYQKANAVDIQLTLFSNAKGKKYEISIQPEKKSNTLFQFNVEGSFGYTIANYDGKISEKTAKKLNPKAEKSDDGNYYLPAGNYKFQCREIGSNEQISKIFKLISK
jgi:photosystem II stability/assembly factor-like uncharacterized protein